ncbi:MAG: archaemetzincin family Zn-dependent metalloprotease [Nitrospirota bacterium]
MIDIMKLGFIIASCSGLFHLPRIFLNVDSFAKERNQGAGIVLVPVGEVNKEAIERLKNHLGKIFNKKVFIGKAMPEPDYAFDKKRNQYLSTAILNTLIKQKGYNAYEKVLGVVDHDLYVPRLNFVFGEASEKVAVISLTRLRQGFYSLPEDKELFNKRALTEAVHELGHTYGLGHCNNPRCVMFFSNTLADTDRKGYEFCPACKSKPR